jgi:FkbM family methyltransferase
MSIPDRIRRKIRNLQVSYSRKTEYTVKANFGFKIKLNITRDVDKFFFLEHFEPATLNFFSKLISSGNIVIDVGANIGIYTLIASKKLQNSGKVYSFEPSDWAYHRLIENINLNSFKNIVVIKKAVSDYSGKAEFFVCEDDAYNSLGANPIKKVTSKKIVDAITLDEFFEHFKIKKVDIIKIDAEGADFLVLKGGEKLIMTNSPVIFCEYNRYTKARENFNLNDMLTLLENWKYKIFELDESKLIQFEPSTSNGYELICLKENHYSNLILANPQ